MQTKKVSEARRLSWLGGLILGLAFAPAHAQSWDYYFGNWLSGTAYQPETSFASMSVSTTDNLAFHFTLRTSAEGAGTLGMVFGSEAYITKAVFNTVSEADPLSISDIQTNGYVQHVALNSTSFGVGGVGFDFVDCFGSNSDCVANGDSGRLQSGEWISWTLNFASPQVPLLGTPPMAIQVAGWGGDGNGSAWFTPTMAPIPEPEAYAMLVAGLALLAIQNRRRRKVAPA